MTAKLPTYNDHCNLTFLYNLEGAFRFDRNETAKKWVRQKDTLRLLKTMCRHRQDAHTYNNREEGYCYLIARSKLADWKMKEIEMFFFFGLYEAGGDEAIDAFFGVRPTKKDE